MLKEISLLLKEAADEIKDLKRENLALKEENNALKQQTNNVPIKKQAEFDNTEYGFGVVVENDEFTVNSRNPEVTFEKVFYGK